MMVRTGRIVYKTNRADPLQSEPGGWFTEWRLCPLKQNPRRKKNCSLSKNGYRRSGRFRGFAKSTRLAGRRVTSGSNVTGMKEQKVWRSARGRPKVIPTRSTLELKK